MLTTKRQGFLLAVGFLLVLLTGLFAESSHAQRWSGGGGSYYRPSYTQTQPRSVPVQRPMPSQMARPYGQMRSGPGYSSSGARTVRPLPPSIRTTAPIARVPSYTGRVTAGGSPILATRTGRAFAVPQQATFSTRMALMSGTSRPALMARMGEPSRISLKEQFNSVASGNDLRSRLIAAKVGNGPIWTSTSKMSGVRSAQDHFVRHGSDFGSRNAVEYVKSARAFVSKPPPGTLTKVRSDGDLVRYHHPTRTFAVSTKDGVMRTFFKVDESKGRNGVEYFNKQ